MVPGRYTSVKLYWFNCCLFKTVSIPVCLAVFQVPAAMKHKTRRGFPRRVLCMRFGVLAVDPVGQGQRR